MPTEHTSVMTADASVSKARRERVADAAEKWVKDLVDRTGRNPLLYYRPLKVGSLELTGEQSHINLEVLMRLRNGNKVRLSQLISDPNMMEEAAKKCRRLTTQAREYDEERGVQTLFLGWGMASWEQTLTSGPGSSSIPASPVLLTALTLKPRTQAGNDFDLQIGGDWQINATLLHFLSNEHDVNITGLDEDLDTEKKLEASVAKLSRVVVGKLPGFKIDRQQTVVRNFTYQKLAMVQDIQKGLETGLLGENILLSAVSGDLDARTELRSRHQNFIPMNTDQQPPKDEYLVLDADSSQSQVINTVLAGRDLVIEGPPGTGKSQTIANLIATLSARGKTVLFVAEKRAAIDAVLKRLHEVGLGDIVLDLHETGGASIKRRVAADLKNTLDKYNRALPPNNEELHEELEGSRAQLNDAATALHERRHPWDVSVYELWAEQLRFEHYTIGNLRVRGEQLKKLSDIFWDEVLQTVSEFTDLGAEAMYREGESADPWASAYRSRTVRSSEDAEQAVDALYWLNDNVRTKINEWIKIAEKYNLRLPSSFEEWQNQGDLVTEIAETMRGWQEEIYEIDGPKLVETLDKGWAAKLLSRTGRRAVKQLKTLCRDDKELSDLQLREVAEWVNDQLQRWASASINSEKCLPPLDLESLSNAAELFQQISSRIQQSGCPLLKKITLTDIGVRVQLLLEHSRVLFNLPDLQAREQLLTAAGLGEAGKEVARQGLGGLEAKEFLQSVRCHSLLEHLTIRDDRLRRFTGATLGRIADEYRLADQTHIKCGAKRVLRKVAERAILERNQHPVEEAVVLKQAGLKSRHMSTRNLLQKAPNILRRLKPCWAMSPLLAAEMLPLAKLFDVVVFDEASQVTPADAAGSIMRAAQAVVCGDTKQLPPTRFFVGSSTLDEEDQEEDDEEMMGVSLASGLESVLEVMAALLPEPYGTLHLQWHYRSRDERLIRFSNQQRSLYNNSLTTFPGVSGDRCVSLVKTEYDIGRTGSQIKEAYRVSELVLDHIRLHPDESLGVIAFGGKHAEVISELLRQKVASGNSELGRWLESGPRSGESLFIKNIERVQGDERDAIILTMGYGRGEGGRLRHQFGPLNMEGGERRLNVAVTRARNRVTVAASFGEGDLDPNRLRAEGAQMLRRYLAYAESGGGDLNAFSDVNGYPMNTFERNIYDSLMSEGLPLIPQYGSAGYRIDFAAQHPDKPGRMVLAIEADGVSYHSSPSARERDRLRQEHLERLGWRFHRIWSTDWFHNREQEIIKVVEAWQKAVVSANSFSLYHSEENTDGDWEDELTLAETKTLMRKGSCPILPGYQIDRYSPNQLDALIRWIASDELLRTDQELVCEAMRELGFKRMGPRIRHALESSVSRVARKPRLNV